jgi:protein-tyrosine phosphatase
MLRRLWELIRPPRFVVWITPDLALGPRFPAHRISLLARNGIGSVIDVRSEDADDEAALAAEGLHLLHLPVDDFRPPTQEQFVAATEWALAEMAAGRKVYVHCRSGIGRSPSIVSAILMTIGYPLSDAVRMVRKQRPWMTLTDSQQQALKEFDRSLKAKRET